MSLRFDRWDAHGTSRRRERDRARRKEGGMACANYLPRLRPERRRNFSCACRPDGCPGMSLEPIFAFVPAARNTRSTRQKVLVKIRLGQKAVEKRYGLRSNGNVNHARYDHKQRAREIHVVCPSCAHMAVAIDMEAAPDRVLVGDMSRSWSGSPFSVACTHCAFEIAGLSYSDLPDPFHRMDRGKDTLWAYNWSHLGMIISELKGESISGHPYEFFSAYIHGSWKKAAGEWLTAISKHIVQADRQHEFSRRYHQTKHCS